MPTTVKTSLLHELGEWPLAKTEAPVELRVRGFSIRAAQKSSIDETDAFPDGGPGDLPGQGMCLRRRNSPRRIKIEKPTVIGRCERTAR